MGKKNSVHLTTSNIIFIYTIGTKMFKDFKSVFQLPEPAEAWTETRDSLDESPISAQYETVTGTPEGDDDCLYLDVATRNIEPDQARPVMVWIHGGAFKSSSNTYKKYGPDYLLRHDIVFVAINYRLGILGWSNLKFCPK